jgi:RHS repeat-associated protein
VPGARFARAASSRIPAGNLIAVTVTSINGTTVNSSLQTDGSGAFSQAQAYFAGTSLAQGFTVQGTVRLTFTGSYPPLGSRLNFLGTAGNVSCTQAGAPSAEIAYIQPDHLGSPRTVTDAQQRVIWRWDQQDPFGGNVPQQDPHGDGTSYTLNLRFPGQYFDVETGLSYNYFRDYDPAIGRYIQADPIGLEGGIDLYAYARNNPLTYIDPDGAQAIPLEIPLIRPLPRPIPGPLDPTLTVPRAKPKKKDDIKDHCARLYVRCKQEVWGGDWNCDQCLFYCTGINEEWPFWHCSPDLRACR